MKYLHEGIHPPLSFSYEKRTKMITYNLKSISYECAGEPTSYWTLDGDLYPCDYQDVLVLPENLAIILVDALNKKGRKTFYVVDPPTEDDCE